MLKGVRRLNAALNTASSTVNGHLPKHGGVVVQLLGNVPHEQPSVHDALHRCAIDTPVVRDRGGACAVVGVRWGGGCERVCATLCVCACVRVLHATPDLDRARKHTTRHPCPSVQGFDPRVLHPGWDPHMREPHLFAHCRSPPPPPLFLEVTNAGMFRKGGRRDRDDPEASGVQRSSSGGEINDKERERPRRGDEVRWLAGMDASVKKLPPRQLLDVHPPPGLCVHAWRTCLRSARGGGAHLTRSLYCHDPTVAQQRASGAAPPHAQFNTIPAAKRSEPGGRAVPMHADPRSRAWDR